MKLNHAGAGQFQLRPHGDGGRELRAGLVGESDDEVVRAQPGQSFDRVDDAVALQSLVHLLLQPRRGRLDAEEHGEASRGLHLRKQPMQIDVGAVIGHPLHGKPRLDHGVAELIDELLVHGQQIVDEHETVVAELFVQESHLLDDPSDRLDAVFPLPERRRGAEGTGVRTAAAGFDVNRPSRRSFRDGAGVASHVDTVAQGFPDRRQLGKVHQSRGAVRADLAVHPVVEARNLRDRRAALQRGEQRGEGLFALPFDGVVQFGNAPQGARSERAEMGAPADGHDRRVAGFDGPRHPLGLKAVVVHRGDAHRGGRKIAHAARQETEVSLLAVLTPFDLQVEVEDPHLVALMPQPRGKGAQSQRRRDFASRIERRMGQKNSHGRGYFFNSSARCSSTNCLIQFGCA